MENETLIKEIDNQHFLANGALKQKNFQLYAGFFADDLKYKQLNGRTINKKNLIHDIAIYFNRVLSSSSDYERISFEAEGNKVKERLIQKSQIALRVFIFFSKEWTIEREGVYEWKKKNEKWEIITVEIINEKVY